MAAGAIPWTAIDRYAERYGIEGDLFEMLSLCIEAMDYAARSKD